MMTLNECITRPMQTPDGSFYSAYEWCLNPILTFRELWQRLGEELNRYDSLPYEWQQEEARTNLYLFTCAIACTVDDYLAQPRWNFTPATGKLPQVRKAITFVEWIVNVPWETVKRFRYRWLVSWRKRWDRSVEQACEMLINGDGKDRRKVQRLREMVLQFSRANFPDMLMNLKMKVPEGFRSQDLTHNDVLTMARRISVLLVHRTTPVLVIGPRTAGAYFAPLVKTYLCSREWISVSWMTVRPKVGVSVDERRRLRALLSPNAYVVIVDEHPNTGDTLRRVVKLLVQFGVRRDKIMISVPKHPLRPGWDLPLERRKGIIIDTLEPHEIHKENLLAPGSMERILRQYYDHEEWSNVHLQDDIEVDGINARLWAHDRDGFHVPLKRVYGVQLTNARNEIETKRVIAKSVGWGWLGYHAFFTADRLQEYVPGIIGLRNGLLIMEWIDPRSEAASSCTSALVQHLSSYIAARVNLLRLPEDPRAESLNRGLGWLEARAILRRAFGAQTGYLKGRVVLRELRKRLHLIPTLIDGRMKREEWAIQSDRVYKLDFEHHNFCTPELDIVDPAYDLASTVFEFHLPESAEKELLDAYEDATGDTTVFDRILLHKLVYGTMTKRWAVEAFHRQTSREEKESWNERYIAAYNFMVFSMNRFCASLIEIPPSPEWSTLLFFMDLDGVFDCDAFGFPHTTVSGLDAVRLLQSTGFSIVLNTGRSIEHVRDYCRAYSFQGGIAEFGSVFFDAVDGREISLIDEEASQQLERCRKALKEIPGVFFDPSYRFAIRAYRYEGYTTKGIEGQEVQDLFKNLQCDRLDFSFRGADTYIFQRGVNKGMGVRAVKQYRNIRGEPVIAIGDSDDDLPMLAESDLSYAPSNCSRRIREFARKKNCRLVRKIRQQGLLAAVQDVIGDGSRRENALSRNSAAVGKTFSDLLIHFLYVAELPRTRKLALAMKWWAL